MGLTQEEMRKRIAVYLEVIEHIVAKMFPSTWGCSYCNSFNSITSEKCINCGADIKSAEWVVDEKGKVVCE